MFDTKHRTEPEAMETTLHLYRAAQQNQGVNLLLRFVGAEHRPRLCISTPVPHWPTEGLSLRTEAMQHLAEAQTVSCAH